MGFMGRLTWSVAAALVAVACGGGAGPAGGDAAGVATIMAADRDFNRSVAGRDLELFLTFLADGATFGGGTPGEVRGRDAIAKDWAPYFRPAGPRLTWTPTHGEVIGGGDLGYTVGSWERSGVSADGQPVTARGEYLTVWRKQADASWKIVYDTGSAAP
jgi:ketosteroid isomerase-like protein